MAQKYRIKQFLGLTVLMAATSSTAFAVDNNFNCPSFGEIQSTNFSAPSIWTAPQMPHSKEAGVGLGGQTAKRFLGAERATVNHQNGWVCVYESSGPSQYEKTVQDYEAKIRSIIESTSYLRRYRDKMNEAFDKAEPYLKKYPKDIPLGFVGYVKKEK